jgi:hypothetical protein
MKTHHETVTAKLQWLQYFLASEDASRAGGWTYSLYVWGMGREGKQQNTIITQVPCS